MNPANGVSNGAGVQPGLKAMEPNQYAEFILKIATGLADNVDKVFKAELAKTSAQNIQNGVKVEHTLNIKPENRTETIVGYVRPKEMAQALKTNLGAVVPNYSEQQAETHIDEVKPIFEHIQRVSDVLLQKRLPHWFNDISKKDELSSETQKVIKLYMLGWSEKLKNTTTGHGAILLYKAKKYDELQANKQDSVKALSDDFKNLDIKS